jgi:hypothetical protein
MSKSVKNTKTVKCGKSKSTKDLLKDSTKDYTKDSTKEIKSTIDEDITEMKDYIARRSALLQLESRQDILSFLMQNVDDDLLVESSDGTRINLDNVSDKIVKDIYIKIKHKIESSI